MTPLRTIRRLHAPLACLAIALMFCVGCKTKQETLSLGPPLEAYRADDGSLLFGYRVEPTLKPDHAGWHWLIVEPGTAELLSVPFGEGENQAGPRTVAVSYKGWGANAKLTPPLLEPGRPDRAPPVVGEGGLTALRFVWDEQAGAVRLRDAAGMTVALMRVSPGDATLRVREYDSEAILNVLKIVAVAGLITGLVFLGGSGEISFN
ncbi:MAG: hypothetical protein ACE37H_12600 [Phycisphaeraceae bacterium]